ncbi:hypothetical protein QJQ45_024561 [Haematococcus lacustris]|nr:hypothetical protein QJQ45_024561 [Haematococcus lacustris]
MIGCQELHTRLTPTLAVWLLARNRVLLRTEQASMERDQPVLGLKWCPVVALRKPPQAPCSSQEATPAAASEPGPSTPPPAKRSKRTKADQAAEPHQPTTGTGQSKGKAAKARRAPQPGRWLDRDCNAALNIQRIGESRNRVLLRTEHASMERDQPVLGLKWCPVVALRKPPQAPCSSQEATPAAASEPGPSTPPPAKRSKRTKADQAAEPHQPTTGTGQSKGKAAKARRAPQPGRWLDRDCNAALNIQRIGESSPSPSPAGTPAYALTLKVTSDQPPLKYAALAVVVAYTSARRNRVLLRTEQASMEQASMERDQPVRGLKWCPVVALRKPPQAPCSSQEATPAAAPEPGPSTPPPAKRSKRTKADQAAEPHQPTTGTGQSKGKAAKARRAPQPGKWLDRDCNAALNIQRIGESRWRPLDLCYWPQQKALPAKGK